MKKQFLETKAELETLKSEKEKEKSCEKKEKGTHEFPKLNGTPAAQFKTTPKHANDILQDAWFSAEDSANLKPYELAIQNYPFENWTETLKQAFQRFLRMGIYQLKAQI